MSNTVDETCALLQRLMDRGLTTDESAVAVVALELRTRGLSVADIASRLRKPVADIERVLQVAASNPNPLIDWVEPEYLEAVRAFTQPMLILQLGYPGLCLPAVAIRRSWEGKAAFPALAEFAPHIRVTAHGIEFEATCNGVTEMVRIPHGAMLGVLDGITLEMVTTHRELLKEPH